MSEIDSKESNRGTNEPKTNIYKDYILPIIEQAEQGDCLFFVSPSTFFGFYSMGASNHERVCTALKEAKERGVELRLIVDVRDAFTAKAAEGLLSFLQDGHDIKQLDGTTNFYFILLRKNKDKSGLLADFISAQEKPVSFLPGIKARVFRRVRGDGLKALQEEEVEDWCGRFNQLWERMSNLVKPKILNYSAVSQTRRYIFVIQYCAYFAYFLVGLLLGILIAFPSRPGSIINAIMGPAVGFVVGLVANIVTHFIISRQPWPHND